MWLNDTTIPLKIGDRVRIADAHGDAPGWITHGTEAGEVERIDYEGETAHVRLDGDGLLHWYPVSLLSSTALR